MNKTITIIIIAIVAVLCVGALCAAGGAVWYYYLRPVETVIGNLPGTAVQVTTGPVYQGEPTQPVLATAMSTPTITQPEQPTPTVPAPTLEPSPTNLPEPDVVFEGVSFDMDDRAASAAAGEVVPESSGSDVPPWEIYPEHIRFGFTGYSLEGTFHEAQLLIYPVGEYESIDPEIRALFDRVRDLINARPSAAPADGLPFLPIWNAAQMMQARVEYLNFQNGSGVRYLTQYGQAAWPINNESMFYTFQGLTEDGEYYISAIFPISNPVLPDPDTLTLDDNFFDNFETYINETEALLGEQPTSSFLPGLGVLDDLIRSLAIHP